MALKPNTLYPLQTTPPSTAYPEGGAQDVTTPGDGKGTPWATPFINDIWGFLQALLTESGTVASGSPDQADASQYLESLQKLFPQATDGKKYKLFAAKLKNTGSGWAIVGDSIGLSVVPAPGSDIILATTPAIKGGQSLTAGVTVSNAWGTEGIQASVDASSTIAIRLSAPVVFNLNLNSGALSYPSYFGGNISALATPNSNGFIVSHPSTGAEDKAAVSGAISPTQGFQKRGVTVTSGQFNTTLVSSGEIQGRIFYNGASWQYEGDMLNAPTITPNGTLLEITHDAAQQKNINITMAVSGNPLVDPVIAGVLPGSDSNTGFSVIFNEVTGSGANQLNPAASPDARMDFFFTRGGECEYANKFGSYDVRRGRGAIDRDDLQSPSEHLTVIAIGEID